MRSALRTKIMSVVAIGIFLIAAGFLLTGRYAGGIVLLLVCMVFFADVSRSARRARSDSDS